jgi:dolichol-phosphate mannosyltransferase
MTVYSETELLVESVARIEKQLSGWEHEVIIVVHPASTPECFAMCDWLASRPGIRVLVQGSRSGIGWAYREAIPHLRGTHTLIMSSDLETDPDDAGALVRSAQETGADIVCASRWMRGGGFSGYPLLKLVLNYAYNSLFRRLYRTSIHDLTFGYKLVRTEVLRRVKWRYGTHEFCAELLLAPLRLGYTAVEVPTHWVKRRAGKSKMTFLRNFRFVSAACEILMRPITPEMRKSARTFSSGAAA